MKAAAPHFTWASVIRVGLVQASLGAVVVLMTATLNRVMVIELGWPAAVPGGLVALQFAVKFWFRPHMGHRSDVGGARTRLILFGMLLLAASGIGAAFAVQLMATRRVAGLLLALVAFTGIGAGVSAAGTSLLALLADRVADERRARAAALVWIMMIAGFIVTTVTVSRLIEPFSYARLVVVTAMVSVTALVVASLSVFRLDRGPQRRRERTTETPFAQAMAEAWGDRLVRRFAIFVFLAMLAYSAQDLILEPFAGGVFHLTPGESTRISGMHQGGMLAGMLLAAAFAVRFGGLPRWAAGGCAASAVAFLLLAASPMTGTIQALQLSVVVLGIANGAFAIGAIGSMMVRARGARAGLMMGIFGAAQAVAYAIGGFLGAVGSDVARALLSSSARGYGAVFVAEAVLFALAALVMPGVRRDAGDRLTLRSPEDGESLLAAIS